MKQKKGKEYSVWNNMKYIVGIALKVQKSIIIYCILNSVITIILNLLRLFIVPTILNGMEEAVSLPYLISSILIFVVLIMVFDSLQAYINANTLFGRIELRSYFTFKIHDKLATTSYPNIEKQDFLDKLDRASDAVGGNEGAISTIWDSYTGILKNMVGFFIYIILLSNADIWLIVITIVTSLVSYWIKRNSDKWLYQHRETEAEYSRKFHYISTKVQEISFAKEIRIFDMKDWLKGIYVQDLTSYKKFSIQKENRYRKAEIKKIVLMILRNLAAYYYIINLMFRDNLAVSYFLLYFNTINGFDAWINGILSDISAIREQSMDITNIREFLEYEEIFLFEDGDSIEQSEKYEIELKNVSYSYPNMDRPCIDHLNLKIKAEEKIAIVGLNGAGKTTLVKLICGFIEPDSGEILLNGKNIKEFNRREYYKIFSAVFQKHSILAASISANIAQSLTEIDLEKVEMCLEKSGLYEKVERLSEKCNTHIGKEVYDDAIDLSGGEMQKLLLARSLYKEASIFVLDEPTAALDPIAESEIYNKYNDLTWKKTAIFISHRLASTRFCDKIIFIEQGKIMEEGKHDELLEQRGKYYELFHIQSKYYQKGCEK